jgi:hypothetical protein
MIHIKTKIKQIHAILNDWTGGTSAALELAPCHGALSIAFTSYKA